MQNYKDLKVWAKAHQFVLAIYKATENFPQTETYAMTSQLRRASASIPANIAEGCGKNTKADFAKFLNIALGSTNESEYFLLLAKDLNYLSMLDYEMLINNINEVKAMLIGLIGKVRG
jgi:four helix bundle protein